MIITIIAIGVFTMAFLPSYDRPEPKITICHWDNGQGGRWKPIEVDEDGWNGHKNHPKDFLVDSNNPCPPAPTETVVPTQETEIPTDTIVPTEITEEPTDATIEPTEITVSPTPESTETPVATIIPTLKIPEAPDTPQIAPVTGRGNIFVNLFYWIISLFS